MGERERCRVKEVLPRVLAHPDPPKPRKAMAECGDLPCDRGGDLILRGRPHGAEAVPYLIFRVSEDIDTFGLAKLDQGSVKPANSRRTSRIIVSEVLDNEGVGAIALDEPRDCF